MKSKTVSRTALRVATTLITLSCKDDWADRLPDGFADQTETLVRAAGVEGFDEAMLEEARSDASIDYFSRYEKWVPGVFEGLGRRKIFMQQQVEQAVADGLTQIAVIGGGFDLLGVRAAKRWPELTCVEIDHPDTQMAKRRGLEALGHPANLHLAAADLSNTPLSDVMSKLSEDQAWRTDAPALFIAEGLFMYLRRRDVKRVFDEADYSTGAGSRIAFSHLNTLWRHNITRLIVAAMGEPWRSASSQDELSLYIGSGWTMRTCAPLENSRDLEGFAVAERLSRVADETQWQRSRSFGHPDHDARLHV